MKSLNKYIFFLILNIICCFKLIANSVFYSSQNFFIKNKYIYNFLIDVVKSENKNSIHKYSDIYDNFNISDMDGDRVEKWEVYFSIDEIQIITDRNENYLYIGNKYFVINQCEFKGTKIFFSGYEDKYNYQHSSPIDWSPVRDLDEFTFIFDFDGDYLYIYYNEENPKHLFYTFCRVTDETYYQIENLIKTGKCDLSKITWPRHADGTCDYEGASTAKKTSLSSTNVSVNKLMSVSENLKLRSVEATSSNVLAVMSAGTKVKILELGKEETIDGINSNWVKVEVISGKDRDGNKLKVGLSGWCYGGYLE